MKKQIFLLAATLLSLSCYAQDKTIVDVLPSGKYQLNTSTNNKSQSAPHITSQIVTIVYKDSEPYIVIGEDELKLHVKFTDHYALILFYHAKGNELDVYTGSKDGGIYRGRVNFFRPGGQKYSSAAYFNLVPIEG